MDLHIHTIFLMIISSMLLSSFLYVYICAARDTITTGSSFSDINNDTLISAGERFELGFFSPRELPIYGRYIGIWYNKDPETVVWIANRDDPLSDPTGDFVIKEDGNLKVLDGNNKVYFTKNISGSRGSNRTVKLLDSGNLILIDHNDQSGDTILWQSFEHPTDTFLPGMKMDADLKLTSRISKNDPRSGNFIFQQDQGGENRFIILKDRTFIHWTSEDTGSFNSSTEMFPGAASFLSNDSKTFQKTNDSTDRISYRRGSFVIPAPQNFNNMRLLVNDYGTIQFFYRYGSSIQWSLIWIEPLDRCGVYNACGNFGICNIESVPMCKCLQAFEPSSPDNWDSEDFSSGCKRKSTKCGKHSKFLNLKLMKVGKRNLSYQQVESEKGCQDKCLEDCQCQAYVYTEVNMTQNGTRDCWIWTSELYSLREDIEGGHNLSVRVFTSDTGEPKRGEGSQNKRTIVVIFTIVIAVVLLISGISYISYRRRAMIRRGSRASNQGNAELRLYDSERRIKELINSDHFEEDDKKRIDVPFFDLEIILEATNNFSLANKLGQGGFGPVYKGNFPGGQEIAVKRLSSHSGQGLEEFKNEVVLIAKLQHRNLVKLLGYCIRGDEKILLYEYMPNKSLDAVLFDRTACLSLDWEKRFDIILGVARGLLYLHEDSRLRIIHRDMKTSNILLDEEMNPKISDFGLARIVRGKETEANTNKVVGTYGYMSPEYALDGLFSIKSDVFSFGVVVLEIVSGKRNTGFYRSPQALNLLGYAWRLWKEEKAMDLMDQALLESCNRCEVLKCIIIGLLCVQEDPGDRPAMSTVVFMLGSEIATLPNPKQPAFVTRKSLSTTPSSSSSKQETHSNNELTITVEDGR